MQKFLRYNDLVELGIVNSRMTLWRLIQAGRFPRPYQLSPNVRAWSEDDIKEYVERCKADPETPPDEAPPAAA